MALPKRFPGCLVGSFLRYDTLRRATFESSPLARKRNVVTAGVAVS
jgi:hypothetical protein